MAGLYAPLPMLRRRPRERLRTARGRCGLLLLHRSGLAPPTPCRSPGALVLGRQIALPPVLVLGHPDLLQPSNSRGRQARCVLAEQGRKRLLEIAGRDALKVKDRDQHLQAPRAPRIRRQDRGCEADAPGIILWTGHCHGNRVGAIAASGRMSAWLRSATAAIASRPRSFSTRSGFISASP